MKRVNVQIPDDIHTRAKVIAVLKGTTLNDYLEQAIRQELDARPDLYPKIEFG